jgi:hypothetical protein
MEPLDFVLIIIPLSIVVAILTALVYYYAHKDDINSRKNARLVQAFIEKRMRQQAAIKNELNQIETLYKNRNIDKGTYQSMQKVILMSQEKQRFEAITTFTEKNKGLNRELETNLESPQVEDEQDSLMENEVPLEEPEDNQAKDEPVEKPRRKRNKHARKVTTRKKKETEIGVISSASTSESTCEEELDVSTT